MIFITLGDPVSIFIECLLPHLKKAVKNHAVVLIGARKLWQDQTEHFGMLRGFETPVHELTEIWNGPGLYFFDIAPRLKKNAKDLSAKQRGQLAFKALLALKKISLSGHAILTGPINKEYTALAGFNYPGQTEYFSELGGAEALMYFSGKKLKLGLATSHLPLSDVPGQLGIKLLKSKLRQLDAVLRLLEGIRSPKIAVCGLNPHASDGGLFGTEEKKIINPAILQLRSESSHKINLEGPLAADTVFYQTHKKKYHGILAMYHDQGLAPLKLLDFSTAVNVSWGLPFLRVSPDHGPGEDIFLSGTADGRSTKRALDFCMKYAKSVKQSG